MHAPGGEGPELNANGWVESIERFDQPKRCELKVIRELDLVVEPLGVIRRGHDTGVRHVQRQQALAGTGVRVIAPQRPQGRLRDGLLAGHVH